MSVPELPKSPTALPNREPKVGAAKTSTVSPAEKDAALADSLLRIRRHIKAGCRGVGLIRKYLP